jgi:hypothetical protein
VLWVNLYSPAVPNREELCLSTSKINRFNLCMHILINYMCIFTCINYNNFLY